MRAFFYNVVAPLEIMKPQGRSFLALCEVLELLMGIQEDRVTPDQLSSAIMKHLRLWQLAYD